MTSEGIWSGSRSLKRHMFQDSENPGEEVWLNVLFSQQGSMVNSEGSSLAVFFAFFACLNMMGVMKHA